MGRKLKVGITVVANTDASATFWSNGIGQNVAFLAMLLQRLEPIGEVWIISSPVGTSHPVASAFGLPVMNIEDASNALDLIIELGARSLEVHQYEQLKKRGGKVVSYVAGNVMVMNFEQLARGRPHGDTVATFQFDATWITPQHWHTNRSYMRVTRGEMVRQIPHIWEPFCVDQAAYASGRNPHWRAPEDRPWSFGCFDPNMNVVKTFHYPLLATEAAYRKIPDRIRRILLFSADHLASSEHVTQMIAALDIGRASKVFVEQRHRLVDVLGTEIDAVVTHNWENDLNYLFWEIIYYGRPLIHNSKRFQDVGYYYPDFDVHAGGEAVVNAIENHAEVSRRQADARHELLWRLSVNNPTVQANHRDLIEEVMG